jgi:hypothetical protein
VILQLGVVSEGTTIPHCKKTNKYRIIKHSLGLGWIKWKLERKFASDLEHTKTGD